MSLFDKLIFIYIAIASCACGREASSLLRQGQLAINDFPLFLTEGAAGKVWKIDRDRTKTLIASGLSDPRGLATDRFQNLYVAEYGAGRVLKVATDGSGYEVLKEGLLNPSVLAVDSFGAVYVAQDGAKSIERLADAKPFGLYDSLPTALAFGVDDQPIVGLFDEGKVQWGFDRQTSAAAAVAAPVNASVDGTGRVYVAQGDPQDGKVFRYPQRAPGGAGTLVADGLVGPLGIAVDLVGDIFLVEQGAGRIVLVTFDGKKFAWLTDVEDPQYLAFTQY